MCVCDSVCREESVNLELMENPARVLTSCSIFHFERFNAVSSADAASVSAAVINQNEWQYESV